MLYSDRGIYYPTEVVSEEQYFSRERPGGSATVAPVLKASMLENASSPWHEQK